MSAQGCDSETKQKFDNFIKDNKITMMTTSGCPACVDAKKLLDKNNYTFASVDLTDDTMESWFHCLYDQTRSHYVPQIFVNSKYIGGYKELNYLNATGLLKDLYHHVKLN